jgi:hypothetical protein
VGPDGDVGKAIMAGGDAVVDTGKDIGGAIVDGIKSIF